MKKIAVIIASMCLPAVAGAQTVYTLQQCRQMAVENNVEARKADREIEQADLTRKQVYTKFFPQVSASAWGLKSNEGLVGFNYTLASLMPTSMANLMPTLSAMVPQETMVQLNNSLNEEQSISLMDRMYEISISAIQPVFLGGRLVNGYRLSKLGVEAAEIQKERTVKETESKVEEYYWKLVSLEEKKKTVKVLRERLNSISHEVETAVKAGLTERNDLLQVQLRQNQLDKSDVELQNNIDVLKSLMAQYMGLKDATYDIAVPDMMADSTALLLDDPNHQNALYNTPEYRLMEKNVEKAALETKIERGSYLPTVAVGASYSRDHMHQISTDSYGMIFAILSVPISNWWGGSYAIKKKKLAEQTARDEIVSNSEQLVIKMQKNRNDVLTAKKQLDISRKSIDQAKENYRLNQVYYKAGTISMSELLEAQQLYQEAQDEYVDDYTDLQQKLLVYKQSVGIE